MARPPRIEFEGARYHVLNRGNYRHAIFSVDGAGECFEEVLFRGCGRFGWVVHAYVILSNHYHLVLETPEGNLVVGMQWVQSTFANRFNRLVAERGHVFQGRYRALLVEDGDYLLRVVNYVHLNPVRAGLVELAHLRGYELGSFPKFFRKRCPDCLRSEDWLSLAGGLKPTGSGMRCYHQYLALCQENDPQRYKRAYLDLCRGWYVGTRQGREAILKKFLRQPPEVGNACQVARFGEAGGEVLLSAGLSCLGKTPADIHTARKGARWKVVLGAWIKGQCGVSNRWLSERLNMGNPCNVSRMLAAERKQGPHRDKLWRKLKRARYKA